MTPERLAEWDARIANLTFHGEFAWVGTAIPELIAALRESQARVRALEEAGEKLRALVRANDSVELCAHAAWDRACSLGKE